MNTCILHLPALVHWDAATPCPICALLAEADRKAWTPAPAPVTPERTCYNCTARPYCTTTNEVDRDGRLCWEGVE